MEERVSGIMKEMSKAWAEFKRTHDTRRLTEAMAIIGLHYPDGAEYTFYVHMACAFAVAAQEIKQEEIKNEKMH